ncbi:MAG: VOC family protein [Pseudomonadota bacterium]
MEAATFTWCDLSTFRPSVTKPFYSTLFGWRSDGAEDYDYAHVGDHQIAALFVMPQKLRDIGMPSFWMSYASVQDVSATTAKARDLGGKIELEDQTYALIRDPLGAGFTVHDGLRPPARAGHGTRAGHGYFCSDLSMVEEFYQALFGWQFTKYPAGHTKILTAQGTHVASAQELPDETRGKEQYWTVQFAVTSLPKAIAKAREAGALEVMETNLPEGPAALVFDPDNAAFFLTEVRT